MKLGLWFSKLDHPVLYFKCDLHGINVSIFSTCMNGGEEPGGSLAYFSLLLKKSIEAARVSDLVSSQRPSQ